MTAREASVAIAKGWRRVRPQDSITLIPQADGGEGTLDAIESSRPGAVRHAVGLVVGPDGRSTNGEWLELPGRVGIVELAQCSGIALMPALDARGATTRGLGQVIQHALDSGVDSLIIAVGGSASTDAGAGALSALGIELVDSEGCSIADGGGALRRLAHISKDHLRPPPYGGVTLLVDVTAPLLGPTGAARTFAAQKGATPEDVTHLEDALAHFASFLDGSPAAEGSGAAGGTAFGFATLWGAQIQSGAQTIQRITGLQDAIVDADVLVTGEGTFDKTSMGGKVVGAALALANKHSVSSVVIAGQIHESATESLTELYRWNSGHDDGSPAQPWQCSLSTLAGSAAMALEHPERYLEQAGSEAALRVSFTR